MWPEQQMTPCRPQPDIEARATRYPGNNLVASGQEQAQSETWWRPSGEGRPGMDKEELLLRYECEGGEDLYAEAKPMFEAALAATPGDARLLNNYGYLLECHGRRMIRAAAGYYQQAIDADPDWAKPRFQHISALNALMDVYEVIPRYEARLAEHPD